MLIKSIVIYTSKKAEIIVTLAGTASEAKINERSES